jgi:hypothetical protein
MEKTSMTETVAGKNQPRKRRLRPIGTAMVYPRLTLVRDSQNSVKMRAQNRARHIGKTLGQVYAEAGVNKAYLSDFPKTGWREDRLDAIARALGWSLDELMHGDESERVESRSSEDQLLEFAIGVAVELLRPEGDPAPIVGRLSRLIYQSLRLHTAGSLEVPNRQSALIWARQLIAALGSSSN